MPQEACRLCGQTNKTFIHTMSDKLITQFLTNAVVRLNNAEKNIMVCNLCYAKAKIVVDFVTLVNKAQNNTQAQTSGLSKIIISTVHDSQSSTTNFIAIKEEKVDSPNIFYNEFGDDSNFYEEENLSAKKEGKRKFKWPKIKHGTGIRVKRAEPQKNTFKCGNCKKEHKNFKALEVHIIKCFKASEEIKCFVCDKSCETKKKLYSHLEIHKVQNKRKRGASIMSQATNHKKDIQDEGLSNDSNKSLQKKVRVEERDMNEVLLERARRLIEEIN